MGAAATLADRQIVITGNPTDLAGGAGDENFIGGLQVMLGEGFFCYFQAGLGCKCQNGSPCDAGEDFGADGVGDEGLVPDDKQVAGGTFG